MKNLRLSVHSPEHIYLRELFTRERIRLGLSQRDLAQKMGVVYSFIRKVETGDRRLDIYEFIEYCLCLDLNPQEVVKKTLRDKFFIDTCQLGRLLY